MILIFGGAYQGKLDYALETFDIAPDDVFRCTRDGTLNPEKTVICGLEDFVYSCTVRGTEAGTYWLPWSLSFGTKSSSQTIFPRGLFLWMPRIALIAR